MVSGLPSGCQHKSRIDFVAKIHYDRLKNYPASLAKRVFLGHLSRFSIDVADGNQILAEVQVIAERYHLTALMGTSEITGTSR
jgi:hypothetical protein